MAGNTRETRFQNKINLGHALYSPAVIANVLCVFEPRFLLVPVLHWVFSGFHFSVKASDTFSYVSSPLTCSDILHLTLSKNWCFIRPCYWHDRHVNCGYLLPHPSKLYLESTGESWFVRFAFVLSPCKYSCIGQSCREFWYAGSTFRDI